MRIRSILVCLAAAALSAACGEVKVSPDDASPPPADGDVDSPEAIDAGVDAPDAPPPPPPPPPGTARELAVSAGSVSDARFTLQLEITGGVAPSRATGTAVVLDGATTVTVPRGGN